MAQKKPFSKGFIVTTITTIISTLVFSVVKYFQTYTLEPTDVVIFAVIFWATFFLSQKYFSKKL